MAEKRSGKCLCGAVQFTAEPKSRDVGICHCGMCRRWSGGPMMAIDCGDTVAFADEAAVTTFPSSEWGERGFCKICGTVLFWKTRGAPNYIMSANAFDDLDGLELHHEIFIDEKPDFYSFANKTEQMTGAEVFAKFAAGSDGGNA